MNGDVAHLSLDKTILHEPRGASEANADASGAPGQDKNLEAGEEVAQLARIGFVW